MKTPMLLDVPKVGLSNEQKLHQFMAEHGIKTYRSDWMKREDHPWIALLLFDDDKDRDIGTIMADRCGLYDESGFLATGEGELSAVRRLCKQLSIQCAL